MASLSRHRTILSGFPGGPGVATMYSLEPSTALASITAFWFALRDSMPADVTMQVENHGDVIEDTTGALTGEWNSTIQAAIAGTRGEGYAAPAGAAITWTTGTVLDGSRVRGRTFVVPLTGNNFATDGSLLGATLIALDGAASALVTATVGNFVVWHRPVYAPVVTKGVPRVLTRAGGHAIVGGHTVADKVAILKSRRD